MSMNEHDGDLGTTDDLLHCLVKKNVAALTMELREFQMQVIKGLPVELEF